MLGTRAPTLRPSRPNERWFLDFVSDSFADGRRFRVLCIVDEFTRECLSLVSRSGAGHCAWYLPGNRMLITDSKAASSDRAIHAIILTLNEERHIARCVENIRAQVASITVIDSGSKDGTLKIARAMGCEVLINPWVNHATQINFGIDSLATRGGWLMRIDADEILDADSGESASSAVARLSEAGHHGILVQRRIHFLGQRIRHGAIEPSWQLRLWRNGHGFCEQRWMDEHINVVGSVAQSALILSDINLNSLSWWTEKHNSYASREAIEMLDLKHAFLAADRLIAANPGGQARVRRFVKEKLYVNFPPGLRSLAYFLYRYCLRLGFLDGRAGFYFHLLQGLWYRALVDAKVAEIEAHARARLITIPDAIQALTGISLPAPVSGQTDQEASSALTQPAQSLDPESVSNVAPVSPHGGMLPG